MFMLYCSSVCSKLLFCRHRFVLQLYDVIILEGGSFSRKRLGSRKLIVGQCYGLGHRFRVMVLFTYEPFIQIYEEYGCTEFQARTRYPCVSSFRSFCITFVVSIMVFD